MWTGVQADLVAGLTVGVMTVPQSLSYARIAGLPSQFGLYGAFAPVLGYALFGSSRQLVGLTHNSPMNCPAIHLNIQPIPKPHAQSRASLRARALLNLDDALIPGCLLPVVCRCVCRNAGCGARRNREPAAEQRTDRHRSRC